MTVPAKRRIDGLGDARQGVVAAPHLDRDPARVTRPGQGPAGPAVVYSRGGEVREVGQAQALPV